MQTVRFALVEAALCIAAVPSHASPAPAELAPTGAAIKVDGVKVARQSTNDCVRYCVKHEICGRSKVDGRTTCRNVPGAPCSQWATACPGRHY